MIGTAIRVALRRSAQAVASRRKVSISSIRRSRHCRVKTLSSISAMSNQLPFFGV